MRIASFKHENGKPCTTRCQRLCPTAHCLPAAAAGTQPLEMTSRAAITVRTSIIPRAFCSLSHTLPHFLDAHGQVAHAPQNLLVRVKVRLAEPARGVPRRAARDRIDINEPPVQGQLHCGLHATTCAPSGGAAAAAPAPYTRPGARKTCAAAGAAPPGEVLLSVPTPHQVRPQ